MPTLMPILTSTPVPVASKNKMMSEAMANRRNDERFQADMTTFSTNTRAQIDDLKKDGKARENRMDKFQAQFAKIDVRSLSNEERPREPIQW